MGRGGGPHEPDEGHDRQLRLRVPADEAEGQRQEAEAEEGEAALVRHQPALAAQDRHQHGEHQADQREFGRPGPPGVGPARPVIRPGPREQVGGQGGLDREGPGDLLGQDLAALADDRLGQRPGRGRVEAGGLVDPQDRPGAGRQPLGEAGLAALHRHVARVHDQAALADRQPVGDGAQHEPVADRVLGRVLRPGADHHHGVVAGAELAHQRVVARRTQKVAADRGRVQDGDVQVGQGGIGRPLGRVRHAGAPEGRGGVRVRHRQPPDPAAREKVGQGQGLVAVRPGLDLEADIGRPEAELRAGDRQRRGQDRLVDHPRRGGGHGDAVDGGLGRCAGGPRVRAPDPDRLPGREAGILLDEGEERLRAEALQEDRLVVREHRHVPEGAVRGERDQQVGRRAAEAGDRREVDGFERVGEYLVGARLLLQDRPDREPVVLLADHQRGREVAFDARAIELAGPGRKGRQEQGEKEERGSKEHIRASSHCGSGRERARRRHAPQRLGLLPVSAPGRVGHP